MKISNNMVLKGNYIYATNLRKEGDAIVADGIYNVHLDENGDEYRVVEYIVTEDGDCVVIK